MTGPTASLPFVDAVARLEAQSFLIDSEVVIISIDGMPDFYALRSRRRGPEAHDGEDLRDQPLLERKQRLATSGSPSIWRK